MGINLDGSGRLVESLYQSSLLTVRDCLTRWRSLDAQTRARCFLVIDGTVPGTQQTLNSNQIADLASN